MYTSQSIQPNPGYTPPTTPLEENMRPPTAPFQRRSPSRPLHSQVMPERASVMIVDDDPGLLTVGRAILSTLDLNIVVARSGEDALTALDSPVLPNLILLDLAMPGGMSGLEAFDAIHERYPQLPVIACSGFFGDGADDMCRHIGFAGMLPKPYTADSLVSVVRRILLS